MQIIRRAKRSRERAAETLRRSRARDHEERYTALLTGGASLDGRTDEASQLLDASRVRARPTKPAVQA
jgi:hypothetical protein